MANAGLADALCEDADRVLSRRAECAGLVDRHQAAIADGTQRTGGAGHPGRRVAAHLVASAGTDALRENPVGGCAGGGDGRIAGRDSHRSAIAVGKAAGPVGGACLGDQARAGCETENATAATNRLREDRVAAGPGGRNGAAIAEPDTDLIAEGGLGRCAANIAGGLLAGILESQTAAAANALRQNAVGAGARRRDRQIGQGVRVELHRSAVAVAAIGPHLDGRGERILQPDQVGRQVEALTRDSAAAADRLQQHRVRHVAAGGDPGHGGPGLRHRDSPAIAAGRRRSGARRAEGEIAVRVGLGRPDRAAAAADALAEQTIGGIAGGADGGRAARAPQGEIDGTAVTARAAIAAQGDVEVDLHQVAGTLRAARDRTAPGAAAAANGLRHDRVRIRALGRDDGAGKHHVDFSAGPSGAAIGTE